MKRTYIKKLEWGLLGRRKRRRRSRKEASKFVNAVSNNLNEREMDRQGRMKNENKTLGTGKCENIDTLYVKNCNNHEHQWMNTENGGII